MESQIPFDKEASTQHDDVFIKDVITSETNHVASNQPVKKPTRQWAAWTRQEEESFFTALRQVGKNFEKITSRVQSKNKDQVRHYYYRLVRRMNKLLGPELSLDAKNSKETNAAMLRWWSLLEKHSCKASKLHLKPRRFKVFLETLEHQLLKDRKKNIKKRSTQGGNVKPPRQRRRSGTAPPPTDAYKKWEKAAIAGVSLVADAAEHLERTALDKLADSVQDLQGSNPIPKSIPPVPTFHQNMLSVNASMKLKLQLFPVDESTRRALEMDNHNPHLELTLSTRKKISSVLEHMTRKWGSSSIASGELTLVPYHIQTSNLTNSQKWNQDSLLTAGDVYAVIGSPPIFRLRYGWFTKAQETNIDQRINNGGNVGMGLSTLEWADSLTNISVGDLLSEVSRNAVGPTSPCHQQISYSCDSFDAAIAAHINKNKNGFHSTIQSSIWDAEETCDAFSFPKNSEKVQNSVNTLIPSTSLIEKSPEPEPKDDCPVDTEDPPPKDLTSLIDMYWPESLGPLDLDVPSCRYHTADVILSDSLGGLNCSLDAFQNCSFFGLEKRETTLTSVGGKEKGSSSDYKADGEV
ncbi:hypothetical protein L1887_19343 [Cichorium endivia]|nr:hypothetical protein L1887_19343 [Cichorium endivia]